MKKLFKRNNVDSIEFCTTVWVCKCTKTTEPTKPTKPSLSISPVEDDWLDNRVNFFDP
ncbi:hypothetical protein PV797_05245 [Clostridiaceae bacterium M8S5]|nr:hypothetical protein PV797_05245 [Clostridiaceae bacterium M8S5]